MWALVEDNTVTKVFTRPKALTLGDNQYPANIFSLWSSSELEAIGIYEVVIDNTNLKNQEYYINTNQSFAFASGTVTASYGTATAKNLDDTLFTADDEAADANNVEGTVATRGLKYNHKQVINSQAAGSLQPTDWMVVRAAEGGTAVPGSITTSRAAVRTKANTMCTAINDASDMDALIALYVYNDATPPVRPLGELPEVS
jgi:hypothetical protein|tara:strand:- start:4410 stop:5012 length:603 start_codon:yes stop_codon:yes gene_type:complete